MEREKNPPTQIIIKKLGCGLHSTVKLGIDQKGKKVAIKQYKPKTSNTETMLNQVQILKSLNHPNIVKVLDWKQNAVLTHRNGQKEECWAMIQEYFQGGRLHEVLFHTGAFSQKITRTYFLQIINALDHIHSEGFTHRDIKPLNIVLSNKFHLKIVDFGCSCTRAGPRGTGVLNGNTGTKGYQAPEIKNRNYDGAKVDIFATGVILFMMYTGRPPFRVAQQQDPFYELIMSKKFDYFWYLNEKVNNEYQDEQNYFSKDFKDLINRMVAFRQKQRITIPQILKHPWVRGPRATSDQIYRQLKKRKEEVQLKIQQQMKKQGKMEQQYLDTVMNQRNFSNLRGSSDLSVQLIQLIHEELAIRRLPVNFEQTYEDDVILAKADKSYAIARLKHLFKNLQIDLSSSPFKPINYEQVQRDSLLQFQQLKDNRQNEIQAQFGYTIETQKCQFEEKVKLTVVIGKDENQNYVFRLVRNNDNDYAFGRILNEVKKTFAYAAQIKVFYSNSVICFINKLNSKIIKTFTKQICLKNKWPDIKQKIQQQNIQTISDHLDSQETKLNNIMQPATKTNQLSKLTQYKTFLQKNNFPQNLPDYDQQAYWDARYQIQQQQVYDWYVEPILIKDLVFEFIDKNMRILQLGSGKSSMIECFYKWGYKSLIGSDFSWTLINQRKSQQRYLKRGITWERIDVLRQWPDFQVNCIFQKATLDCLPQRELKNAFELIYKKLSHNGTFFHISCFKPQNRINLLKKWDVKVYQFPKPIIGLFAEIDETKSYYAYVCKK